MRQNSQNVALEFIVLLLFFILFQSNGRELRPAEHGLAANELNSSSAATTTNDDIPEMLSFFGGNGGRRNTQPPVALPIAENVTWSGGGGRGGMSVRRNSKAHVRDVLLISSLVCGAIGVVFLAVSVFVCVVLRFRREKSVQKGIETTSLATSVDNVALAQKGT